MHLGWAVDSQESWTKAAYALEGHVIRRAALLAVLLTTLPGVAAAQDAQYWTYQYGTRANLLGGAVVGSVVDVSATYYNPGALALIAEPELVATSKVFELTQLALQPDVGTQIDLDNLRFDLAPGFVGGIAPFAFLGDDVLGYSIFTRHQFKANMDAVRVGTLDELPEVTEEGDYLGLIHLRQDMSEFWVGVTWSRRLGRRAAIGVSTYVASRNHKYTNRTLFESMDVLLEGAFSTREIFWSYWDYRLLWKVGIAAEWQGVSLGFTLTTPSISVFNSGRALINLAQSGVDTDGDGADDQFFATTFQESLSASFKSPLSLGLGASYSPRGSTTIHFSTEYFAKVNERSVMELADFEIQSSGDTVSASLNQKLDDVLNFALGVEHELSPTVTGYASFRTDFSARPAATPGMATVSSWDLYFITAGSAFRVGTADLTLGVAFGWGGDTIEGEGPSLPSGPQDGLVIGVPETLKVKYRTLRFILSFAI